VHEHIFAEEEQIQENGEGEIIKQAYTESKKQIIVLGVSLLMFSIVLVYALSWSNILKSPWFRTANKEKVIAPAKVQTSIKIPSPTLFPKSQISIQIKNGSGIKGQAAKIEELLIANGYTNTQIENAQNNATQSSVLYNSRLSLDQVDSLLLVLKNVVAEGFLKEATNSGQFYIVITTGK
jgi:hypothetical protein